MTPIPLLYRTFSELLRLHKVHGIFDKHWDNPEAADLCRLLLNLKELCGTYPRHRKLQK